MNTIGSKIFSLVKFVNNLDLKVFLDDNSTLPCNSISFLFVDKDHNHIITVNFKNIKNNKLQKLFSEGTKYPANRTADYQKTKECIITGIKFVFNIGVIDC